MLRTRGWQASTTFAPAAWSDFEMNQAKLSLSPTPVTRAILPERSIGVIVQHLAGEALFPNQRPLPRPSGVTDPATESQSASSVAGVCDPGRHVHVARQSEHRAETKRHADS